MGLGEVGEGEAEAENGADFVGLPEVEGGLGARRSSRAFEGRRARLKPIRVRRESTKRRRQGGTWQELAGGLEGREAVGAGGADEAV